MSQIRGRDTKAEIEFRKYIWKKGIRGYRIKNKVIGKPDLYFPKKKIAIFVDGCFWHKCPKCFIKPKSKKRYWNKKIKRNIMRDKKITSELKKQKLIVLRFWEHEVKKELEKCYYRLKKVYEKKI